MISVILLVIIITAVLYIFTCKYKESFRGYMDEDTQSLGEINYNYNYLNDPYLKHIIVSPDGRLVLPSPVPPSPDSGCKRIATENRYTYWECDC